MRRAIGMVGVLAAIGVAEPAFAQALTPTPPGAKTFVVKPTEDGTTLCPVGLQLKSVQALAGPDDAAVSIVLLGKDRKDLPEGRIVTPYGFRLLRKVEAAVRVVMICGY